MTYEDPLPDLNIVYSRVIHEEQNMTTTRSKESSSTIVDSIPPWSRDPSRSCTQWEKRP